MPLPEVLDGMALTVCEQGSMEAVLDQKPRRMDSSSIMVLRPGHHIKHCRASEDFKGYIIVGDQAWIERLLPSFNTMVPVTIYFLDTPAIKVSREELQELRVTYDGLQRRLHRGPAPLSEQAVQALCHVLFFDVLAIYLANLPTSPVRTTRRQELMTQFVQLVEENFRTERSVSFYAGRIFVTPKHLSAIIRSASGHGASEWIDQRVLAEARELLGESGRSIQEIAQMLNFRTQSLFGKYFKQHTGMSPREYRQNQMGWLEKL